RNAVNAVNAVLRLPLSRHSRTIGVRVISQRGGDADHAAYLSLPAAGEVRAFAREIDLDPLCSERRRGSAQAPRQPRCILWPAPLATRVLRHQFADLRQESARGRFPDTAAGRRVAGVGCPAIGLPGEFD